MPAALSNDARTVLALAEAAEDRVTLPPGQLDRKIYEEVNKALDALGGKWNRKARAHLFTQDPRAHLKALLETGEIPAKEQKVMSFWPTPDELADRMVAPFVGYGPSVSANGRDRYVIEPSAGDGAIVRALRRQAGEHLYIVAVEPNEARADHLEPAGANEVHRCTFERWLEFASGETLGFVMNPPFTTPDDRLAYVAHLEMALDYLESNDGGDLVCVVPGSWPSRQDKRITRLRDRVEEHGGGWSTVPDRMFASVGTNVSTLLVEVTVG